MNGTESQQTFIHINWSGTHSLKDVESLNGPEDFGVYQVYGNHPVYGSGVLLYIGRAVKQTFKTRFAQPDHVGTWQNNPDAGRVEVYVGRLWGLKTPDDETWNRHIILAERLLIYVHEPAKNAQKELKRLEPDLRPVHILNWHCHRDLLPEVSGAAWTGFADNRSYCHFSTAHNVPAPIKP